MTVEEARKVLRYCEGYDSVFVSLNRFERKKRIDIAINAMDVYRRDSSSRHRGKKCVLIVAGGYDKRVTENVEYLKELETLCQSLSLPHIYYPTLPTNVTDNDVSAPSSPPHVIFRTSISSSERTALFTLATGKLHCFAVLSSLHRLRKLLQRCFTHPIENTLVLYL